MQHISDKQAVENKTDLEFIYKKKKKLKKKKKKPAIQLDTNILLWGICKWKDPKELVKQRQSENNKIQDLNLKINEKSTS